MEESLNTLTVLYTAELRGDLDVLPRLSTFLRRLREEFRAGAMLLLDLGDACAPDVWHCEVTEGRSMLMALDGLGYNAANVSGFLSETARQKVEQMGAIVQLALHTVDQAVIHDSLRIDLTPSEATVLDGEGRLSLAAVTHGEVGVAHLAHEDGAWRLASSGVYRIPPGQLPDPTIAGMIEFILAEASYARKRRDERG